MRRSNRLLWLALLGVAVLGIASCSDDGGPKPDGDGNLSEITIPFRVGNQWTFVNVVTDQGDEDPPYDSTERIVGSRVFDGQSYWILETLTPTPQEADTSYIRQSGQLVFIYPDFAPPDSSDDEFSQFVQQTLRESRPWKVADFSQPSGRSWDVLNESRTWSEAGGTLTVSIRMSVTSEGRKTVQVPKGTYTDAHQTKLVQTFSFTQNTPPLPPLSGTQTVTQTFYVKNGVGIVSQDTDERFEQTGSDPRVWRLSTKLKDFTLQP